MTLAFGSMCLHLYRLHVIHYHITSIITISDAELLFITSSRKEKLISTYILYSAWYAPDAHASHSSSSSILDRSHVKLHRTDDEGRRSDTGVA